MKAHEMKVMGMDRLRPKHVMIGIQAALMAAAICYYLLNRGHAYSRVFTPDEYAVPAAVTVAENVTADGSAGAQGVILSTPALRLEKGTYQIQVNYFADRAGSTISATSGLGAMEMRCSPAELRPSSNVAVMTLDLTRNTDDAALHVTFPGEGSIRIDRIGIYETSSRYKKNVFYAFLLCLFITFAYCLKYADSGKRRVMLALSGIFCVTCYPLYADFLTVGHDLPYHLLRIDAICEGLKNGVFPVKLHPLWANGQGYAIGIFYGDALLYFPAFLRLLGFSIQSAYQFFVAFINLGTVLLSYYSFRRMFSDEKIGLLGCLAYTLAYYRLMDVYTRAAVGEYIAMMAFPFLLCGFYLIFSDSRRENWAKHAVMTAGGLTVLIQSHILSCLMAGFLILLACILLIRRTFRKYVFCSLVSAAALTILWNLNFIVPFLDFYREDVMIHSPDWSGSIHGSFQAGGVFPVQLFTLFQKGTGGAWSTAAGIHNEAAYGIGILLTIGLGLFFYLWCVHHHACRSHGNYRPVLLCALLSCLLLFMSTCYFPWDAIASVSPRIEKIISTLEFPWRLLGPATALLTFVLCYSFDVAGRVWCPSRFDMLLTGCLVLFAANCGWYFYDFAFSGEPYRVYDTYELSTMQMYSYDYLPGGTDPAAIRENEIYTIGMPMPEAYQKSGTTVRCRVSAGREGGYVEFPLLYYKYYRCTDINFALRLPVSPGTNNMVRVDFPGGYSGSIKVQFVEPWFWRAAEIISFLTFAGTAAFLMLQERFDPLSRVTPFVDSSADLCEKSAG